MTKEKNPPSFDPNPPIPSTTPIELYVCSNMPSICREIEIYFLHDLLFDEGFQMTLPFLSRRARDRC